MEESIHCFKVHDSRDSLEGGTFLKAAFVQSQPRTHKHLKRMNDVPNHGDRVIAPGGSQTELLHMSVPLHGFGKLLESRDWNVLEQKRKETLRTGLLMTIKC